MLDARGIDPKAVLHCRPMSPSHDSEPASQALLSAALGGLLCVAASACTGSAPTPASANAASGGAPGAATATSASFACDGGLAAMPGVTFSTVANLTLDAFASQCTARNGVLEIQPHCGGLNNGRGMSYDTATQTLTEHTCRGTNTCAGYACIVCD
ncbi:MAG: hypothetical protein JO000_19095 [Alphaproteobacteria bacterium]|nr:hypothetical protein [Alphaproteobacteria bacterium]